MFAFVFAAAICDCGCFCFCFAVLRFAERGTAAHPPKITRGMGKEGEVAERKLQAASCMCFSGYVRDGLIMGWQCVSKGLVMVW